MRSFASTPAWSASKSPGLLDELLLKLAGEDLGRSLHQRLTARAGVKFVDFDNLAKNSWHVVTELPFVSGDEEFRPDITLLLNGMPLSGTIPSAQGRTRLVQPG